MQAELGRQTGKPGGRVEPSGLGGRKRLPIGPDRRRMRRPSHYGLPGHPARLSTPLAAPAAASSLDLADLSPGRRQRVFWAYGLGDAGTGTTSQTAVRDAYYTFTGTTHTDLWLQLGDNAYNAGTDAEYQANMFNVYATMLRKSVTWPTLGNHETNQSTTPPAISVAWRSPLKA